MDNENVMEEGKILLDENKKKYYVSSLVDFEGKHYAVCMDFDNPKQNEIFEYRHNENGELETRIETNVDDKRIILAYALRKISEEEEEN